MIAQSTGSSSSIAESRSLRSSRVVLVGLGNVGSPLASLLARFGLGELWLIDGDRYDRTNLRTQSIDPGDVGLPKAEVVAARARSIDPELRVEHDVAWLADLPWGRFRSDLVISALDSRRARLDLNEIVIRLGLRWLDVGVHGDFACARATLFVPDESEACSGCGMTDDEYATLEATHACSGKSVEGSAAPTGASAELGTFAAASAAIEARKLLLHAATALAPGEEWVTEVERYGRARSRRLRDDACRFDHRRWVIDGDRVSLEDTIGSACIERPGRSFARRWLCSRCGSVIRVPRVESNPPTRCPGCGAGSVEPCRRSAVDRLGPDDVRSTTRFVDLGLRPGDIVSVDGRRVELRARRVAVPPGEPAGPRRER
ncbi:MAG: ThiF family adenylyltransferase [Planctomycetes bacterium]|nr:ThiF family adenylyltransferase [Planctomycetota bacterium]